VDAADGVADAEERGEAEGCGEAEGFGDLENCGEAEGCGDVEERRGAPAWPSAAHARRGEGTGTGASTKRTAAGGPWHA
jgi:hypothetical protein